MIAIIGLGNPGATYLKNRHNIGFRIIDACASAWNFTAKGSKFKADLFEGKVGTQTVKLLKPQTFMNLSGETAQKVLSFYKLTPSEIWVVYDDFDLPFGTIRLRENGSPGTHNGARSITQLLGSQAFPKLRIGIGPWPSHQKIDSFVLSNFSAQEEAELPDIIDRAVQSLKDSLEIGLPKAMSKWNNEAAKLS